MADEMDLVRRFYAAINRADVDAAVDLYHSECVVEHVFTHDDGVYEGRETLRDRWRAEVDRYRGELPGGHRIDVTRVAGMETGWGWVRADWRSAVRDRTHDETVHLSGYSHFWIEHGAIRRQRSIGRAASAPKIADAAPEGAVPAIPSSPPRSSRLYPDRPIVGVGAVVLTGGGVVLVKRRFEPLAGQWSLPGGTLEVGETLEAGVAREIVEETGLVIDVGPVIEVFDRILVDETGRVRYHFVLVDYLCRPRGGTLRAGSDVDDVSLVNVGALDRYRLAEKARVVIQRAVELDGATTGATPT